MEPFERFKKNVSKEIEGGNTAIEPADKTIMQAVDSIEPLTEQIIMSLHTDPRQADTITLPLTELGTLGSIGASLLPAFRTITETTTVDAHGLYRLANASVGDALKQAKDGTFWGAFKTAAGGSKMAKLTEAGPLNVTSKTSMPINPAMVMIAAALYTIDKKLDSIAETQKRMLSFLENEKESQIEADVNTLTNTLREFKFNWDKELFVTGHYKLVLDIKRTVEKNLQSYQKELQDIKVKTPVVANAGVNAALKSLLKKFRYYKMSLYLFSMASFIELILLGDFREEHILKVIADIEERSMRYRQIYGVCSAYIEKAAGNAIETNLLKGIGNAGKAIGGLIGSIPLVKEGPVDEWLQDSGDILKKNARGLESSAVHLLAEAGNPDTGLFTEKLSALNKIHNHMSEICFDRENIYLIAD